MTTSERWGIDPELRGALGADERPDLSGDLTGARRLMGSSGLPVAAAEVSYGPRVDVVEQLIDAPGGVIEARVYIPRAHDAVLPGVLMLHGGAFVGGDRAAEHARSLRYAAEVGCVVVCPEYRLAPEHPYPAAIDDALRTLEWMRQGGYGIDADRIALAGVSAGGALAAGAALKLRDTGAAAPRALLLLFPALDDRLESRSVVEFTDAPVWDAANTREMWSLYLGGAAGDAYAAPARADRLVGLPRSYILAAECDPLRDEAVDFARRMLDAGIPVDLRVWASTFHVFDQLAPESTLAQAALEDQLQFLRRYL